jgi:hypothetical protein
MGEHLHRAPRIPGDPAGDAKHNGDEAHGGSPGYAATPSGYDEEKNSDTDRKDRLGPEVGSQLLIPTGRAALGAESRPG